MAWAFHAPISTDQLSNERIIPGPNPNYGASHIHVTCVEVFRQPQGDAMSSSGIGTRMRALRLVISLNMESKSGGKGEVALIPFQLIVCSERRFRLFYLRYMPSKSRNQSASENEAVRTYLSVYPLRDTRAVTLPIAFSSSTH